mgnify:CR=1 FL=1
MTGTAVAFGRGAGLATREDLASSLNNAALSIPSIGGDKAFLKLGKGDGLWVYGQEEIEIEPGALIAVNPYSLRHGYIAWLDGQVEDEVMVPINRPLPSKDQLKPVHGEQGWQQQISVDMAIINGEDEGVQLQYKQSSVGAMKAMSGLVNTIMSQLGKDPDNIVPIIRLDSDSYKHKKWGKIFNPVFEVVEWRSMDGDAEPASTGTATSEAKPAEQPAQRTRQRPTEAELTAAAKAAADAQASGQDDDAALDAEYAREQAAQAAAPRRRNRR